MQSKRTGEAGEAYAVALLERESYKIIARNFHSVYGEVDIIALDMESICFVEVKTRKKNSLSTGQEAITPKKQLNLIRTALCFLQERAEFEEFQPRFDVCVVNLEENGIPSCHEYLKAAFDGGVYEGN